MDQHDRDAIMNVIVPRRSELQDPAYLDSESEGFAEENQASPSRTPHLEQAAGSNAREINAPRKLNAYGIGSGGTVDWRCSVCTWSIASAHPRNLEAPRDVQNAFEQHRCEDHDKLPFNKRDGFKKKGSQANNSPLPGRPRHSRFTPAHSAPAFLEQAELRFQRLSSEAEESPEQSYEARALGRSIVRTRWTSCERWSALPCCATSIPVRFPRPSGLADITGSPC